MLSEERLAEIEAKAAQVANACDNPRCADYTRAENDVPALIAEIRRLRAAGQAAVAEHESYLYSEYNHGIDYDPDTAHYALRAMLQEESPARVLGTPPDHAKPINDAWRVTVMGAWGVLTANELVPIGRVVESHIVGDEFHFTVEKGTHWPTFDASGPVTPPSPTVSGTRDQRWRGTVGMFADDPIVPAELPDDQPTGTHLTNWRYTIKRGDYFAWQGPRPDDLTTDLPPVGPSGNAP